MSNSRNRGRLASVLASSILLGACASTPPHTSIADVEKQLGKQYPTIDFSAISSINTDAPQITNEYLTLSQTIQLLLTHSPKVPMLLAQIGIADAEMLQAGLIDNPYISIGAIKPEDGGRWQLESSLSQPLLAFLTRPLRQQLAQENLLEAQLLLQKKLQALIAETSRYYFAAVAAKQHYQIQEKMVEATEAKQQLALSLYRAGNISENNFLSFDNELRRLQLALEKRKESAIKARLVLFNTIGLASSTSIAMADQLPILPPEVFDQQQLLSQATTNRVDIKIARQQLAILNNRQKLVHQENGWRDINLGVNVEREFDGATNYGPEVEFALPVFNRGQGKIASLNAQKTSMEARLQQLALDADTSIAQALNTMESSRVQLDTLQAALMVAGKRVELSNREVNFMLGSPFELLTIRREQIQLAHDFTDALKSYWQARTDLELAIGQALPLDAEKKQHAPDHSRMDHSTMNHSPDHNDHSHHQNHTQDHSKHEGHNHD